MNTYSIKELEKYTLELLQFFAKDLNKFGNTNDIVFNNTMDCYGAIYDNYILNINLSRIMRDFKYQDIKTQIMIVCIHELFHLEQLYDLSLKDNIIYNNDVEIITNKDSLIYLVNYKNMYPDLFIFEDINFDIIKSKLDENIKKAIYLKHSVTYMHTFEHFYFKIFCIIIGLNENVLLGYDNMILNVFDRIFNIKTNNIIQDNNLSINYFNSNIKRLRKCVISYDISDDNNTIVLKFV